MRNKAVFALTVMCFVFILFFVTLAESADYDACMAKGKAFLIEKKYAEAADEFRKAIKQNPEDHSANLNLGIALSRSGSRESETYLKKALSIEPSDSQTNLELGIYYYNRQVYAEAGDYFENIRETSADTEYIAKAEESLEKITGAKARKPWSLGIAVGEQYDSNVLINPDNSPLPEGITRKSDWKNLIYINGRVKFIMTERAEASLGYSLYQTLHYNLHDFNITQNLADLSFNYKINPALSFGGSYKFEYILVGGKDYDIGHSIGPSVTVSEGRGFFTEIQYRYKYTSFKDKGLFINNSERSGLNSLISVKQNIPVSSIAIGEVGYAYDRDTAKEDFWKYDGNKVFASLNVSLPSRFFLNLYSEYYAKNYDSTNPFSDKPRRDKTGTYSISATRLFTDNVSISLSETYINNSSNINVFAYNRSITTLLVNVRF